MACIMRTTLALPLGVIPLYGLGMEGNKHSHTAVHPIIQHLHILVGHRKQLYERHMAFPINLIDANHRKGASI